MEKSNHIIAITDDFIPILKKWNVPEKKISVISNWAPLEYLPVRFKQNSWSTEKKLTDKFCFMYTGTLGMKHNPNLLLQLAKFYKKNENVRVVVISEGLGANWLKNQKSALDIDNLIILGFQPFDQLANVMGTADVLLALLKRDAGVFSVPSKVLSIFLFQAPNSGCNPTRKPLCSNYHE